MKQFNNLSTWREETVVVKGKECFDLNFRDTTPNMFVIQNPNNAELYVSISKIPTSKNYEFKIGKNCTDTLGRPTPTNRIYIFNNADIDATIKVFSVMDTFDMNILKNFAVSLDSGEMQMDGVVKGFDSDVSLPAGSNFMGYVGLSDSERQSFADMLTSLSNIKTDTNNMLAIKNNVVNTWDCINKITNMLKGTFSPSSGEVDNIAEIIKKIIDFPTLSEYLYTKDIIGSCDFAADIPEVETVDGYVSDTVEDLRHLSTTSDIKLYIAGNDSEQIGSVIDANGTEYKIYPRTKTSGGKTKYLVTAYMGNGFYNANIDLDSPIISLSEFVTKFNNCRIMGTLKAVGSCKLAMGFTRKKNGIGEYSLSNYYTKLDKDNFFGHVLFSSGMGDYAGTYDVSIISKTTHTYANKTFYGVKFRFKNVDTSYTVDVDYFDSGYNDINNLEYGCIYNLETVLNYAANALYYGINKSSGSAEATSADYFNVFGNSIPVYKHNGILSQLMSKVKIPTIAGYHYYDEEGKGSTFVSFSNSKSTESNPIKIADCIKFVENISSTGTLKVNIYYTWRDYFTLNIPPLGKIENIDLPIYEVSVSYDINHLTDGGFNILGGLYG